MERPPEDTGPGESLSAGGSLPGSSRSQIERLRAENAWLRAELGSLRALQTQGEDSHGRILEGIPAAVFVTLVDGRVIELANRAGVELLGASDPAEVVGRSLLDFVHPDDLADALERGERAALGEPIAAVSQGRLIRLDGAEVVVERSVSRGTYRGKPILQSVLYDITARVRTEEALETSEARFRDLAESSLLGMSVVTADEPPRVLYANRAFKRIYGFAEDAELSGLHHLEALVAAHERSRIQRYRAARRAGRPAPDDYEHDAVRVDGSPITVRVHVNRLTRPWDGASALMLSFLDVTSQRQAEAALRESEARFRDFAAAASDWYWETDPVGRITFVSERFAEITGIDPGEVLGKTRDQALAGTLPADELAQEQKWARFRETLEAKRAYRDFTYRWIDREGALRTLSSSAVPVLGRDGEFFGYRGVGRDLTGEDATRRALDDERERLARAEATASLGNWEWRLDSGTVVWSSGMYAVAGVDPDRFVVDLDSATGIFAEEDLPAIRDLMRLTLKTHEPFSYRARIVRPSGEVRRVIVTGECEADRTGRVELVFGVVQDVTERDRAEALLRDAVASIPDGFAIYDADDRLVLFNDAYRDGAHGAQDLVRPGLLFEDLIRAYVERGAFADPATSTPDWLEQRLARHRQPGPPIELEFSDGTSIRIIERRSREGGTVVLRMDITEARRAEARLLDAIEGMPHGFLLWDADDRLLMANEAFYRANPGEAGVVVPGARFEDVMTARVREGLVTAALGREETYVRQRLDQHRNPTGEPIEQEFADGRWFEIRESRTREGGILAFRTEITARKRVERELARHRERLQELVDERTRELADTQAELLRAERLAAIGQVTATVSHELRNPLGTMRTSIYVLEQRLARSDPSARRLFERIERSVDRCVTIIEELLAYTRVRPLVQERQRLGEWCRSALEEVESPPGVALMLDVRSEAEASFDDERLRHALLNVVQNAFQAFEHPGGGDGTVRVSVTSREDRHELCVEDDGEGIAPEVLEHVFEPLFSTRPFGIGLGLPVVRQAMEQHGGGIVLEGAAGAGTRVVLWLPSEVAPVR